MARKRDPKEPKATRVAKPKVVSLDDVYRLINRVAKPKVVSLDDVYRLINRVQLSRKQVKFTLLPEDAVVAENVLRDLGLEYTKKDNKGRCQYTVIPNPEEVDTTEGDDIDLDLEFLEDEIPEDGSVY